MRGPTCSLDRCFGLFSTSILRRPTPMAPDETMMTLWPSFRSLTAVSTMDVRMERSGSWLFSSTMELVPGGCVSNVQGLGCVVLGWVSLTELDHDAKGTRTPHGCTMKADSQSVRESGRDRSTGAKPRAGSAVHHFISAGFLSYTDSNPFPLYSIGPSAAGCCSGVL